MGILSRSIDRLPVLLSGKASPKNIPTAYSTMAFPEGKQVPKANAALFRHWSEHSEWVRAAIDIRKRQVSAAEWDIVSANPDIRKDNKRAATRLKQLFDNPNPRNDSFRGFIEPVIEDLLVLDAGCVEFEMNLRGEIAYLWPVNPAHVRISSTWDGDADEARYFWWPPGSSKAVDSWLNTEFVYMMANPRTYSVQGLSPLETLKMTIESELSGHEYNRRQVQGAAPDGMIDLGEGIRPDQVDQFKSYWLSEVAGKGAMAFIGGSKNAKFVPFRGTNREMQFLEWQLYLVRKISAVFQISPQDLGISFDVNRSTSEVQQENTEDRGLRTLLSLIQDYLTREVVWHPTFGGSDNNLAFRFTRLNLKETLAKAQINKIALAGAPYKTINEARKEDGREPLGPQFDIPIMATPVGAVSLEELLTAAEAMRGPSPATASDGQSSQTPPAKPPRANKRKS